MDTTFELTDDPEILSNAALLHALAPQEELRQFPDGAVVFAEGMTPSGIYIMLAGAVDMHFATEPCPIHLTTLGTILGLNAAVSGRPSDYTATVSGGAVFGYVTRERFLAALAEAPSLWMHVLKVLSRDIGSCYDRVRQIVTRHGANGSHDRGEQMARA